MKQTRARMTLPTPENITVSDKENLYVWVSREAKR